MECGGSETETGVSLVRLQAAPHDPKRRLLLEAAQSVFGQVGYRRASMAQIAAAAGVSRPALYLHFKGKPDVFRALAEQLRDDALSAAAGAWLDDRGLGANLEASILAKDLPLFELLHVSPHGGELMDVDQRLTAAIAGDLEQKFGALLTDKLSQCAAQGQIDLTAFGRDPASLAGLILRAASGIKGQSQDSAALRADVASLALLVAAATRRS